MRHARLFERLFAVVAFALLLAEPSHGQAQGREQKDRFTYHPVQRDLWAKAERLIETEKGQQVFRLAADSVSGAEADERKILIAKALAATGQRLHAQYLFSQIASKSLGTRQGFEALRLLHELARSAELDDTHLEDFAFDLDTKVDEPESRSMIGYFRARALLRKGYDEWARAGLDEIAPASTWKNELAFEHSQQALLAGYSGGAYTQFEAVMNSPVTRVPTARQARLNLARLLFEKRDYKASIATYTAIELPTRERARSLNELAWSYYHDRVYGKALGAIRALKSRYFSVLVSPETYLLEILIYRELCHFKHVKDLAAEFMSAFKPVFSAIERRRPLENIPQFLQMLLQEGVLQRRANAIQSVRAERRVLEKQRWADDEQRQSLVEFGKKRERLIDAEITRVLRTRGDSMANAFLDLREQVWFLDYEAAMRMIQLNEDANNQYEPPKANAVKPEVMFWPANQESWKDELLDYENLVHDACKASPTLKAVPGGSGK